jgi:hypothetical protein
MHKISHAYDKLCVKDYYGENPSFEGRALDQS